MNSPRIFPVILAGGASSRLWPASNRSKPKWDLRFFSGNGAAQSLLQGAFERARAVAQVRDCFVVTGADQAHLVSQTLPELPPENILVEPEPRDTAGALAFALGLIQNRLRAIDKNDPAVCDGVMLVLSGDHVISPVARFSQCANAGAAAAVAEKSLVTFGIVARSPATSYGYIHRGAPLNLPASVNNVGDVKLYRVQEFREKPDRATAEQYLASGEYYWNGGIFLWQFQTLLAAFEKQLPLHASLAKSLRDCYNPTCATSALAGQSCSRTGGQATSGTQNEVDQILREQFTPLKKTSIDFGIMERAEKVICIASDFDWDDIGSWSAVAAHLRQEDGNAIGPDTQILNVDASRNIVFAPGKRVALIGVENLAVIESDGQILICRLDRDQDVKKISEMAKK